MIRKVITTFLVLGIVLLSTAQDSTALIHFKQRMLKHKTTNDAIDNGDSLRMLHLMIGGNIYQTEKHINYCYDEDKNTYNFRDEFKYIQPILSLGDITIANLKTAFGGDNKNMYSAPDEFALALKYSGVNAVMHANLHTANVSRESFNRTRDLMNEFDIQYVGAYADQYQRTGNFPLIINKKGFKIAILNYGTLNNRPPISRNFYINEIDKDQIASDMRMAHAYKPDFTIVYFDWGANMQDIPAYYQIDLARFCFQLGASLVVGTHPNAPMRIDYVNYNSNTGPKEGIVAYSLGNLIASNDEVRNRNGYLMDIELTKNNYTGETKLADWGVIPVYTYYDTSSVPGKIKVYPVPCSAVETGDILANIPYIEKRRVINGAYEIRKLVGGTADEIQYNETELVANNVQETIDLTNAAWNNKYSQKRKEEIKPTDPPSLPVAKIGTNNPPSLANIYETPPPLLTKSTAAKANEAAAKKEAEVPANNYDKEKNKLQDLFVGNTPDKPAGDNVGASTLTPVNLNADAGSANPSSVNNTTNTTATNAGSSINNNTGIGSVGANNTSVNTTNTASANNDNSNSSNDNSTNNTSAKTNNTPNTPTASTATAKDVSDYSNTTSNSTAKTNTTTADDEASKNRTATTSGDDERTKGQQYAGRSENTDGETANTNYHTQGNSYTLPEKAHVEREKHTAPAAPDERAKETSITINENAGGGISTNIKSDVQPSIKPVEGKQLTLVVDTFYRIQIYALTKYLPLDTNYYTHLKGYDVLEENGYYKYMLGMYKSYQDCLRYWKSQIQPRYKQSFIVKYIDGRRVME
jgi:poly-gamma-glutamate synthesis protein (capsule biosynthesis protein)